MSSKAPINDLQDIAKRKQQLRAKIEVQERKLSKDLDAYQDDVETFKKVWSGLKGVRHFGQKNQFFEHCTGRADSQGSPDREEKRHDCWQRLGSAHRFQPRC